MNFLPLLAAFGVSFQQPSLPPSRPPVSPQVSPQFSPPPVILAHANDNRARAGILYGTTLALRLEARLAEWHPNGDDEPGAVVPAFAEQGRAPQIPGPLIRVPSGTEVVVTLRNMIPNATLTVHGLHMRPVFAVGGVFNDSIQLAPGAVETLRFRLDRTGTYYYWATTTGRALGMRTREDAQLSGAIVVDEAGERQGRDRVFVIGQWSDTAYSPHTRHRTRELYVVNGRSWPYTDRLVYSRGDTVRWRVINASADMHAMHLHGFYFRATRRGDGRADTLYGSRGDLETTERLTPGATVSMSWIATRLGGWLFHDNIPADYSARGMLGFAAPRNASNGMGGLATAVEVRTGEDDTTEVASLVAPMRSLRLIMSPGANIGPGSQTHYYSIALQEGIGPEPQPDPNVQAGPPIVLYKDEPTQIMVVNRLTQPTSVHWHGLELESFYDGVPGISGIRPDIADAIAPLDSFDVRVSAPRTGTFVYHSHMDAAHQMRAGLVGPLIVVEPGKYDPTKEIPVLLSSPLDSLDEERAVLINGSLTPASLDVKRGVAYRLRLINETTNRPDLSVELRESRDSVVSQWRLIAKDGADTPAASRTLRSARRTLTIGETADFEFSTLRAGDYRLEVKSSDGTLLGWLELRLR